MFIWITVQLSLQLTLHAISRPEDPLRVLGEYLIQKSKELEGTR